MKNREMFKDQLNEMLDDNYWEGEEQRFEDVATQDIVTPFSVTKKGCLKKCEPGWRDDCNDCIFYIPFHCPEEEGYTCDEECSECSFMLDFLEKNDCLVALKKWLDSEYKMVAPKEIMGTMIEEKRKKNPYIIAVDFDGTLCKNAWPEIGAPNVALINYLKKKQAGGDKLILWTSRSDKQVEEAVEWCKEHGLVFDAVNDNLPFMIEVFGNNCRKIFANEYIDDRNRIIQSCIEEIKR